MSLGKELANYLASHIDNNIFSCPHYLKCPKPQGTDCNDCMVSEITEMFERHKCCICNISCSPENNIKDIKIKHKTEIKKLQETCKHPLDAIIHHSTKFRREIICSKCGKIFFRTTK